MTKTTYWVVLSGAGLALLYFLSPILMPFILGAFLAYLGDPFVRRLHRWGLPRTVGVLLVFAVVSVLLFALLFLLLPLLGSQLLLLSQKGVALLGLAQEKLVPWLHQQFGVSESLDVSVIKQGLTDNAEKIGSITKTLVQTITHSSQAIIAFVSNMLLVPVVAFYLMRDWQSILTHLQECLPQATRTKLVPMVEECSEVVGAFFKGQLLVMLALATVYSIGLWVVGIQVALIIGVLSGAMAIVPYLGFTVGIVAASVAAYLEFHNMDMIMMVWVAYGVGQALESMVFTPLFVGDKIGLHPVAVIFALMAGGVLFGLVGVMLALPAAAVILVMLRHFRSHVYA